MQKFSWDDKTGKTIVVGLIVEVIDDRGDFLTVQVPSGEIIEVSETSIIQPFWAKQ